MTDTKHASSNPRSSEPVDPVPLVVDPVEPIDTSDETAADLRGRKANPLLERILDEIQVTISNLPAGTPDSVVDKLKAAHSAILGAAKGNVQSKADREEQDKFEAELKKPQ